MASSSSIPSPLSLPGPSRPSALLASTSTSALLTSPPVSPGYPVHPAHPGCVLCGIVASAASASASSTSPAGSAPSSPALSPGAFPPNLSLPGPSNGPGSLTAGVAGAAGVSGQNTSSTVQSTLVGGKRIVYRDAEITVFAAEGKERLAEKHVVVVLNQHVQTVYDFGPADIPLLSHILTTAQRLLVPDSKGGGKPSGATSDVERGASVKDVRVGFMGSVMRDPQFPYAHLHAQAYVGTPSTSLASFWRRNVVYSSANWWDIEDLRAEIRESSSNNRVKSGYPDRGAAPIDRVPDAGSVAGLPNALNETLPPTPDAAPTSSASASASASAASGSM